jgi:hypothetical protein
MSLHSVSLVRPLPAQAFNAVLERIKTGVFYRLSKRHLKRYINEVVFRWNHRKPVTRLVTNGKRAGEWVTEMVAIPVIEMFESLLNFAIWRQVRTTANGGIRICSTYVRSRKLPQK